MAHSRSLAAAAIEYDWSDLSVCINHQTQFAIVALCNSLISRTENANYGNYPTQFALRLPLDARLIRLSLVSAIPLPSREMYDGKKADEAKK